MMDRTARAWTPLIALLVCWLEPTPVAAQTSPSSPASATMATQEGRSTLPTLPQAPTPTDAPLSRPTPSPGLPASSSAATPATPDTRGLPPALPSGTPAPPDGGGSAMASASILGKDVHLKTAPLEPTDLRFPINLATALRLSDARPLIVAAAQASVWVAEAQLTRAKVLWVPTLNIGADYIRHDGGGPDFNKGIMTAPSVNFFYGGVGAIQSVAVTDAFFEPLVARQVLNSRQWDIQAAKNDALMMTANAYFSVHQYRGMYAGALYTVERGHDLVERINQLSKELVPKVEVDRARNMVADLEQQATAAREAWRVNSADLTQVLRLDPRAVIVPLEHDHLQITVIDPGRRLDDLMPVALVNRPELGSQQALVKAVVERIGREKFRPLTPTIMLNGFQTPYEQIQAGIFGIGSNSKLNQWKGRADTSYQALWQLDAFGVGNLARIKEQRGEQSRAIIDFFRYQDMIAGDVTRAQARLQSAAARVSQADRALRTAVITFNGNFEGLRHTTRFGEVLVLVNRPQEVVFALQLMKQAFDQYFTTVAEYNRAQFELFHAIGYPARELADLRPPGEVQPVDTTRPAYLPPVGNGPPPATR
ncbi:MAG: TolC family protein [Paludisphaera borealis]|uniref:TolC family protein n=1 Tax=Paludisphaera borealis TaxID=1387353 RepID=UPI0028477304|nr:TolC family protein [Paludisphaera borealis]MDR3622925.1 TolC family protein [Paludisphaera borealis]